MIRQPLVRFTMFTVMPLLLVAVSIYLTSTQKPQSPFHPRENAAQVTNDKNGFAVIYSGVRRHIDDREKDVVDYVVIERFSFPHKFQVRVHTTKPSANKEQSLVLELPERMIDLPADHQLLQLSDGEFTTLDSNVDTECLAEFLSTFSPGSSIEELAALAESKQN